MPSSVHCGEECIVKLFHCWIPSTRKMFWCKNNLHVNPNLCEVELRPDHIEVLHMKNE